MYADTSQGFTKGLHWQTYYGGRIANEITHEALRSSLDRVSAGLVQRLPGGYISFNVVIGDDIKPNCGRLNSARQWGLFDRGSPARVRDYVNIRVPPSYGPARLASMNRLVVSGWAWCRNTEAVGHSSSDRATPPPRSRIGRRPT